METKIENRKPIWKEISKFYLDTELQESDYISIAKTLKRSKKSIDELKEIDLFEVFSVCKINWVTPFPIGALDEFKTDWLNENCTKNYKKRKRQFFIFMIRLQAFILGYHNKKHWLKIEHLFYEN